MNDYGFCLNPEMVRVDLFKGSESMKYYTTLELKWDKYREDDGEYEDIKDTFIRLMKEQYPSFKEYYVVCLSPYHRHSYPLMIKI